MNKIKSSSSPTISLVIPSLLPTQLTWFVSHNLPLLKSEIDKHRLELILVSAPHSTFYQLKQQYPHLNWLAYDTRQGFAPSVNYGFKHAHGRQWWGTINDDVLLNKNFLARLLAFARPQTGALNPVIVNPQGKIESAGIKILPQGKAVAQKELSQNQPYQTDVSNAACVLYRTAALKQVGLFDSRFGSYLEDIDLSIRLQRSGWQQLVCPAVRVIHHHRTTSKQVLSPIYVAWLNLKNWWLLILKHWELKTWLRYGHLICLERLRNLSGLIKSLFYTTSANWPSSRRNK